MHTSIRNMLLLAFGLLLFGSCNTSKKLGSEKIDRNSPGFFVKTLATNQVKAKWFSARAKIDFKDDYTSIGGIATINMIKDSLIWVSVRKLGFEVARAKITKDSVYIINRLNNEYDIKGLDYLAKEYNIPASLEMLQAMILGNPVFFTTSGLQLERLPAAYRLFGRTENMSTDYLIEEKTYQLQKMGFDDFRDKRQIQMKLEDYQQLPDNQNFSYFRILEMNSAETGKVKVEMKYSQLEINTPKDISFEIPNRYSRASY